MTDKSTQAKLVLAGPVGVGKTTAIRAITDGDLISTEMPMSSGPIDDKHTTTVALDFSSLVLDEETELLVFGLPGQAHFHFMRPIVLNGAFGVIVLLDGRSRDLADQCRLWLEICIEHAPNAQIVIGVTHTDLMRDFSITPLREHAFLAGVAVPIFTIDARNRPETLQLMRVLLLSAH